jgi:hypothetical protein
MTQSLSRPLLSLVVACCISSIPALAQTAELARAKGTHQSLRQAKNEEDRLALHHQLPGLWEEAMTAGGVMEATWDDWQEAIVVLGEGTNKLVVFTWNVELENRSQRYGGWIAQANPASDLGYDWALLKQGDFDHDAEENRMFRHDGWHGCLYFDGVLTLDRGQPVYTLLAWDGHDALTNRKWVESVEMRKGRAKFGIPNISMPEGLRKRCVLTYGDAIQAAMRFEKESARIVMDHLAPESPEFEGQKAFYGPTLSYDALVWRKGGWQWEGDVEVANPNDGSRKQYRDPAGRSRRRN